MSINLPAGFVPARSLTRDEILTGPRRTSFRYELLTQNAAEVPSGDLDGVTTGDVSWSAAAQVKAGGTLQVVDTGQDVDWLTSRIRVWCTIDGLDEFAMVTLVPTVTPEQHADTGTSLTVSVDDKSILLAGDALEATYALAAGADVFPAIADLVASVGEDPSDLASMPPAPLAGNYTAPAGASKLTVINELLDAAGYFGLRVDPMGRFYAEPYSAPASRTVRWEFVAGPLAIHAPDFTRDADLFNVPNRVVAISQGDGENEGLVEVATNEYVDSPFSMPRRGRWITEVVEGVEVAGETEAEQRTVLAARAQRVLFERSTVTDEVRFRHALIPGLTYSDLIGWQPSRGPAGLRVVNRMTVRFDPLALVETTAQAVSS